MWIKLIFLAFSFLGFGLLASGGVFTVFVTVGLVPRFADKTRTAKNILWYENSIVAGAIVGCLLSVFPDFFNTIIGQYASLNVPGWEWMGQWILVIFGFFAGMFVGCFAIAIAEMLNTIPIFTRRVRLGKGAGIVMLCLALGKTIGSLFYFYYRVGY